MTYLLQEEVEWVWESMLNENVGAALESIENIRACTAAGQEPTQGDFNEAEWVIGGLLDEASDFKEAFAVWIASLIYSDLAEHFDDVGYPLAPQTRKAIRNKLLQTNPTQGEH